MKKISYKRFIEEWEKNQYMEVHGAGNKLIAKDGRVNIEENPIGYILVYCDVPIKKPWYKFW